jgi:type I restriction enzyme S subunit|tara:strand:+ start:568 stop:1098 length:531 start_codon:yes stop_codon:yes gene_type:complete
MKILHFEDCLDKVKISSKLQKKNYLEKGDYPVVAQENSLINGYTNDKNLVYEIDRPIIIFGDHTRKLKYIDFNFVLGADGAKIIKPKAEIDVKFFFYYLTLMMPKNIGYARHYKLLKKIKFNIPSLTEQKKIVAKLDTTFTEIDNIIKTERTKIKDLNSLKASTIRSLISKCKVVV